MAATPSPTTGCASASARIPRWSAGWRPGAPTRSACTAHIKYPIVGDPLYGGPLRLPKGASDELIAVLRGFRRQALHAETLEFAHPVSGEPVRVTAPVPADMLALLAALRADTQAQRK